MFYFRKSFRKKIKTIENQGRKQTDAIINQNKTLAALNNKDDHDHKDIYKEIYNDKETLFFREVSVIWGRTTATCYTLSYIAVIFGIILRLLNKKFYLI